jgi:hypothetical protein
MADRQCEKCGEMVDSARAFCPSCGNPFVAEQQREQQSNYERMDNTVQMGNTMYGQMLSDMGLNISKPQTEKRVETIAPIAAAPPKREAPGPEPPRQEILKPVAEVASVPVNSQPTASAPAVSGRKSYLIWGLIAAGLLFIGIVAVVLIAVIFYFYLPRVR